MNEQLRSYLAIEPQLYPHELEQRYPRVLDNIAAAWGSPEDAAACFDELLIDQRWGRQGFPPDIAHEIFQLSVAYEHLGPRGAPGDVCAHDDDEAVVIETPPFRSRPQEAFLAAETGDVEALRRLLDGGMDLEAFDARTWTPLMVASFHGHEAAARLLIEHGANPRARDRAGYNPLHWAALQGHAEVVKVLSERVDCDVRSNGGTTALLQGAANGHAAVVRVLLDAGADPNIANNEGWTALHKAVANDHVEVVRLLVEAGASPRAQHVDGTTPLGLALKKKRYDIVQMLRQANVQHA